MKSHNSSVRKSGRRLQIFLASAKVVAVPPIFLSDRGVSYTSRTIIADFYYKFKQFFNSIIGLFY